VESREVQQINGVGGLTMDGDNEPMDGARRAEDRTRGEGRWLPGPIHYPPTGPTAGFCGTRSRCPCDSSKIFSVLRYIHAEIAYLVRRTIYLSDK
jgi:hypothetical protein